MVLKRHIKASSIAEVVIALAIIALCFTVASLVFIRSNSAAMRFTDFRTQSEVQSELMEAMMRGETNLTEKLEDVPMEQTTIDTLSPGRAPIEVTTFFGSDNRIIWTQEWMREE